MEDLTRLTLCHVTTDQRMCQCEAGGVGEDTRAGVDSVRGGGRLRHTVGLPLTSRGESGSHQDQDSPPDLMVHYITLVCY